MENRELPELGDELRNPRRLYSAGIVFAVVPLIVGVFLFLLWLVSRDDVIALMGVVTIFGGLVSVLIAVVLLLIYLALAIIRKMPVKQISKSFLVGLLLIFINFPVAFACVSTTDYIMSTYLKVRGFLMFFVLGRFNSMRTSSE